MQPGDKSARALIAPLLNDVHPEVRTSAMMYMMRHHHIDPLQHVQELDDFADYSIRSATVAYLARPGEDQNIEAARVITGCDDSGSRTEWPALFDWRRHD